MSAWKDKQLGSFIDMKVVRFLKADLGIYCMSGTVLGMNWPVHSPVLLGCALGELLEGGGMSKPIGK